MSFETTLEEIKTSVKELKTDFETLQQEIKTKSECEAKGGKWDPEKKTCKLPEKKESVEFDQSIVEHRFKTPMIHLESGDQIETLEQAQVPAYTPPAYAPPKYPAGLYPIPKLRALITKLAKQYGIETKGTLADLLGKLGATEATTKEECEAKGGKWDPDTKTCKIPKKESVESVRVLPSSTPLATPNLGKMNDKQFNEYMKKTFPNRWEEKK